MAKIEHQPVRITPHLFQLGTTSFPAYLSVGEIGMLIEGGTGPTFSIIVDQIEALGIDPGTIRYVVLTHTHADHIGALPHLKRAWPHLKVLASRAGTETLKNKDLVKEFLLVDLSIAQLMRARGETEGWPAQLESYSFEADSVITEGERIDLGAGVTWRVYETPGHSACHLSLYEENEKTLAIGDATGFYVPERDIFWPNYFQSLEAYCNSIRKLSTLPARRGLLSHNIVIDGDVEGHLRKAMTATEQYHRDLQQRMKVGEVAEKIAFEKAQFVSSLTDIQPFRIMYDLCRLMVKRSEANGKIISFSFPVQEESLSPEPAAEKKAVKKPSPSSPLSSPALIDRENPLTLTERLGLIALMDEGMRLGFPEAPMVADLFEDLGNLMDATVSGSRIDRLKPEHSKNPFQLLEINAESGENLGRLNMLYLKKPIPSYYLVYVEVAAPFRKRGLGTRILKHFGDFLNGKDALGILDNVIPADDPTYDIYLKQSWRPIQELAGDSSMEENGNYMIFIPPALKDRDLKRPLSRLLHHLKRRRTIIDMRDNEAMVKRTVAEFKELHQALLAYFAGEIQKGEPSPLMQFMFTRFVTKLIAFRRRIGTLVGYTGGESMEQLALPPEVARLEVKSYPPHELANKSAVGDGDLALLSRLPEELKNLPASFIESLPNYRRPSFAAWLKEHGKSHGDPLTLDDLVDLGFDPTRLKEIVIGGEGFIFERLQERHLPELRKKNRLLERITSEMAGEKVNGACLKANPVLLVIRDRGNAYVLRRRINAIHLEEAVGQFETHPRLKGLHSALKSGQLLVNTLKEAHEGISKRLGVDKSAVVQLTPFVSWDLVNNLPKMVIDFEGTSLESVWMA